MATEALGFFHRIQRFCPSLVLGDNNAHNFSNNSRSHFTPLKDAAAIGTYKWPLRSFDRKHGNLSDGLFCYSMANLVPLSSYVTPVAIPPYPVQPVTPDFVVCARGYGSGLRVHDAFGAAGQLPENALPVVYTIEEPDLNNLAPNVSESDTNYRLPRLEFFGGVSLSIDVSGPVDIDRITLIPNDIRGMAGWVAQQCIGNSGGVGGFVTKKLEGLVDFVTDPRSDVDVPMYPGSTAFVTLTISSHQRSHLFPGDYDPQMATVLMNALTDARGRAEPSDRSILEQRFEKFRRVKSRMRRSSTFVPWWGDVSLQRNQSTASNNQVANMTTESVTTARRRKRAAGLLR